MFLEILSKSKIQGPAGIFHFAWLHMQEVLLKNEDALVQKDRKKSNSAVVVGTTITVLGTALVILPILLLKPMIPPPIRPVHFPEVNITGLGIVRGLLIENEVEQYLGIPYSKNVSGAYRFSPARIQNRSWSGAFDARSPGLKCWSPSPFPGPAAGMLKPIQNKQGDMGEECLNLNIYRKPVQNSTSKTLKPVMFWIHGGGMTVGSNLGTNGTDFVKRNDVILVMVNYRLGPLGFLNTHVAGSQHEGSGTMNGINDQIVALQWVKAYIENFGGDPNLVTVFGVSAGGLSTCILSISPRARDLFSHSIIESGR